MAVLQYCADAGILLVSQLEKDTGDSEPVATQRTERV
jgi:hypothetical protein